MTTRTKAGSRSGPQGGSAVWMRVLLVVLATLPLGGCELVADIFRAGMWVGVIMVVLVIAIAGFIAAKISRLRR